MTRWGLPGVLLLASALVLTGCGAGETTAEPRSASTATTVAAEVLPQRIAKTREAIVAAAHAFDYEALGTLLDPAAFSYSFGESGDPLGYWRRLEEEAEVPILGDILPNVLGGPWAKRDDIYVWPSAYGRKPSEWTDRDRQGLRRLYGQDEIKRFEESGDYTGWRAGIREDGTWLFFVSGD